MTYRNQIHITSKWAKTKAIQHDPLVGPYVPHTLRMSAESLRRMLSRYDMVYIKPVSGTFGHGVMRVETADGASGKLFMYQVEKNKRLFKSFSAMYQSILKTKRNRPYLVQKGIHLLKYHNRPFDIRVMVQKNARRKWETTGIIGRVAHPRRIVTNYHSGGTPTDLDQLLMRHANRPRIRRLVRKLSNIGAHAAMSLSRTYPKINMVGADIGIDKRLYPWIIELNTMPDPYLFRHLKDKAIHRKVLRYARALGRIPTRASSARSLKASRQGQSTKPQGK